MATSTLNAETAETAVHAPSTSRTVRYAATAGRVLLGLLFFVMGLNGFLNFIPQPATGIPEGAVALSTAFLKSGYLFPLIKGTELLVGALLLSNRLVPLALVLLAPVVVNIIAFHAFLAPAGLPLPLFIVAVHLFLAWTYRSVYRPLLTVRATPGA